MGILRKNLFEIQFPVFIKFKYT
ncbi:MAG: hypothetical protein H6Q19_1052, partial [Bacteroidetes bacterium]|nr:hypothetical protein [Bacteroidota bacterium]